MLMRVSLCFKKQVSILKLKRRTFVVCGKKKNKKGLDRVLCVLEMGYTVIKTGQFCTFCKG